MNKLETFLACVVGFRDFRLDDYRGIALLVVLAFVRDYSCNVTRVKSETCSKCSKCSDQHGDHHLENLFRFIRHSAYFLKFGAKVQLFFDIYKRERDFFLFFRVFFLNYH